jgi:hypothetical protein
MSSKRVTYRLLRENHPVTEITLLIDDQSQTLLNLQQADLPAWAKLNCHQCRHCPLSAESSPFCPVASCLAMLSDKLDEFMSHDAVTLEVVLPDRTISTQSTAQRVVGSLLGLMFATSGCPHMGFFKPMARFHLPLASDDDTLFRATGMYLLSQYYVGKKGGNSDWNLDGLKQIYKNVHEVNTRLAERVREPSKTDTSANAVIFLDMFTNLMPYAIEDRLVDIEHLFENYLQDSFAEFIHGKFAI